MKWHEKDFQIHYNFRIFKVVAFIPIYFQIILVRMELNFGWKEFSSTDSNDDQKVYASICHILIIALLFNNNSFKNILTKIYISVTKYRFSKISFKTITKEMYK